jgi:hypothetical protein
MSYHLRWNDLSGPKNGKDRRKNIIQSVRSQSTKELIMGEIDFANAESYGDQQGTEA